MQINLVMFKTDGSRHDFPLRKSHVVLGRTNRCDLRIPLASVSRRHCEIEVEGEAVRLRDLGSSNGTFHNAVRVQEAELSPGDKITVGPVIFTLVVDGQPEQVEPVRMVMEAGPADPASVAAPDAERTETELEIDDPITALEELAEDDSGELPMIELDDEEEQEEETTRS